MNIEEALEYLHNTCKPSTKPGLERIEKIVELMGNPQNKIKTIHVAGTNGKGSTSAILLSILNNAGYKVGFYSSPHLHSYTERMTINGHPIPEERLGVYIGKVKEEIIPQLIKRGLDQPSEFEVLTAIGFQYFYDEQVDLAIIEVGLGGRWDATNIITPLMSIITPVSIDHCNYLGDKLESIAREKGGIIKKEVPLILAPQQQEARTEILNLAHQYYAPVEEIVEGQYEVVSRNPFVFSTEINGVKYEGVKCGLRGQHQMMNSVVAMTAASYLSSLGWKNINKLAVTQGVELAVWPGRQELFHVEGKRVLIDGAHNQAGIETFVKSLSQEWIYDKLILILGILDDKDKEGMMQQLAPLADIMYITKPNSERAKNWEQLAQMAREYNKNIQVEVIDDYKEAIDNGLMKQGEDDLVSITGSLYLIGDCRAYLLDKVKEYAFRQPEDIRC